MLCSHCVRKRLRESEKESEEDEEKAGHEKHIEPFECSINRSNTPFSQTEESSLRLQQKEQEVKELKDRYICLSVSVARENKFSRFWEGGFY
jgi:hypothetical protein